MLETAREGINKQFLIVYAKDFKLAGQAETLN